MTELEVKCSKCGNTEGIHLVISYGHPRDFNKYIATDEFEYKDGDWEKIPDQQQTSDRFVDPTLWKERDVGDCIKHNDWTIQLIRCPECSENFCIDETLLNKSISLWINKMIDKYNEGQNND